MAIAFIGVGSNLGDRLNNLIQARIILQEICTAEIRMSPVYETAPQYVVDQPYFLNAVFRLVTELSPTELLHYCQNIERKLKRIHRKNKGPRTIDLDILLYDDWVSNDATLTLPHPGMTERRFALQPLCDLEPDLLHPVSGTPIALFCERTAFQEIQAYAGT